MYCHLHQLLKSVHFVEYSSGTLGFSWLCATKQHPTKAHPVDIDNSNNEFPVLKSNHKMYLKGMFFQENVDFFYLISREITVKGADKFFECIAVGTSVFVSKFKNLWQVLMSG